MIAAVGTGSAAAMSDDRLVELWLHGRSPHTQRAYRRDVARFRALTGVPLASVTLGDLQAFADALTGKDSSRGRAVASIKSLLSFCAKLGAIPFNVGAALQKIKSRDALADRIISETDVSRMLALSSGREHALIRLLYNAGLRVSEALRLEWAHLAPANDGGAYVTVFGKGGKTRTVRISANTAHAIELLRSESTFIFAGRRTGPIVQSTAWRMVRTVANKAGLTKPVSPHFMRHAHASHSLERGAAIALVRDTLGHSSVSVTDRYLHARPGESSSQFLPV